MKRKPSVMEALKDNGEKLKALASYFVSLSEGAEARHDDIMDLVGALVSPITDEREKRLIQAMFYSAITDLATIAQKHAKEDGEEIMDAMRMMLMASVKATFVALLPSLEAQVARTTHLEKINNGKAGVQLRAKEIAAERWSQAAGPVTRIGEMADEVYRALVAEGFTDHLPHSSDRIKSWIRDIAPLDARKGGRPSRKPSKRNA